MSRPRAALLTPYWSFFEPNVALDLRADRTAVADEIEALLRDVVEITESVLVDCREAGAAAGRRALDAAVDVLVVVQTMAVPPAYALEAIKGLPDVPLVLLATQRRQRLVDAFSHADITTDGATVGVPQLANVLHRTGRRHATVPLVLDDDVSRADVRSAVHAAGAAGRIRRARLGRVGRPIDGYDCVDVDVPALQATLGCTVVDVDPADVRAAYLAAPPVACGRIDAEVRATYGLVAGVEEDECLERSVRFAAALEELDERLGLSAGVMNCHVAELRHAENPGITPCFALGRETSRGTPWTCSGDVVTAVAMLALKALGHAAVYHEIEALDHITGEAVLANTGEHDLAWADDRERPELRRNVWFDEADPRCGACASFSPPVGPASLVAFTPHAAEPSGFRFIVAEGEYTDRRFPLTGTVNAAFRFRGGEPVGTSWARWSAAGPNHHSAATVGWVAEEIEAVAGHLGIGCVALGAGAAALST